MSASITVKAAQKIDDRSQGYHVLKAAARQLIIQEAILKAIPIGSLETDVEAALVDLLSESINRRARRLSRRSSSQKERNEE